MEYIPIMSGKKAEFNALLNTDPNTSKKIMPLIVVQALEDVDEERENETANNDIDKLCANIDSSWKSKEALIDFSTYQSIRMNSLKIHPLTYFFSKIDFCKLITPVVCTNNIEFYSIIKDVISKNKRLCVRLKYSLEDLEKIDENLNSICKFFDVDKSNVDVMLDYEYIMTDSIFLNETLIANPLLSQYKNVIFAASSFPQTLSDIRKDTCGLIDRKEWLAYKKAKQKSAIKKLVFSDYNINNPNPFDFDPKTMQTSANIRYTYNDKWVIFKGQSTKQGFAQMYDICDRIVKSEYYFGDSYSWGDKWIKQCSEKETTTGNATTWRAVGTNHHIKCVLDQLSSLS